MNELPKRVLPCPQYGCEGCRFRKLNNKGKTYCSKPEFEEKLNNSREASNGSDN